MIYGINPYTISSIRVKKFRRYGRHPSWTKVMKRRNPIRGLFGLYDSAFFDGFYPATVMIYGSDGDVLKQIPCRSNDFALELCDDLYRKLDDFVESKGKCDECRPINR